MLRFKHFDFKLLINNYLQIIKTDIVHLLSLARL